MQNMDFFQQRERTFSEGKRNSKRMQEFSLKLTEIKADNKINLFNQFNSKGISSPVPKVSRYGELPVITSQSNIREPQTSVLQNKRLTFQSKKESSCFSDSKQKKRKYTDLTADSNSQSSSVSPRFKVCNKLRKDAFSPEPKQQKQSLISPLNNICEADKRFIEKLMHVKLSRINGKINIKSISPIKMRQRISPKKKLDKTQSGLKKQLLLKLSKHTLNQNTLATCQLKHKEHHHRRRIRKFASHANEQTEEKVNPNLFSFENFGDALSDSKSSPKKCTMDLSKIVSDHELEKMKSTILATLGRKDLVSPSKLL